MKIYNAALDNFDERNYPYSEIVWNNKAVPDFIVNDDGIIQDQYKEWYNMWCVYYSVSMHDNFLNIQDWINESIKWSELCEESTTWSRVEWDYIINWPKLLKDKDLIKWYAQIDSLDSAFSALADNKQISTWTNMISWAKTRTWDYYAQGNSWAGHAFTIIWYNRTNDYIEYNWRRIPPMCFIVKDSSHWFNAWYFYIKIEDFDRLLYRTRLTFINNTDLIDNYKKMVLKDITNESAKLAFLLGIWNGKDGKQSITREDTATMVFRSININEEDVSKAKEELQRLES